MKSTLVSITDFESNGCMYTFIIPFVRKENKHVQAQTEGWDEVLLMVGKKALSG